MLHHLPKSPAREHTDHSAQLIAQTHPFMVLLVDLAVSELKSHGSCFKRSKGNKTNCTGVVAWVDTVVLVRCKRHGMVTSDSKQVSLMA